MTNTAREMKSVDAKSVVDYFVQSDASYLHGMGADKNKLPDRDEWIRKIQNETNKPFEKKEIYYVIWQVHGMDVGHSNINQISYGLQANMHLHIWNRENRRDGNGLELVRQTIPKYFEHFKLKKLICEPYAKNPAPVKTLENAGFKFIRAYETTPGIINFQQTVNRYEMSKDRFEEVY